MVRVIFSPEARIDLIEITDFILRRSALWRSAQ
jgi:plasmid stabilization system protein ParE